MKGNFLKRLFSIMSNICNRISRFAYIVLHYVNIALVRGKVKKIHRASEFNLNKKNLDISIEVKNHYFLIAIINFRNSFIRKANATIVR